MLHRIKASCFFLLLISCSLSQNTSAVDKVPVTTHGISILKLCMPPEQGFIYSPVNAAAEAHCKIENILLKAYREAFKAHTVHHTSQKLLNAAIWGRTRIKGPNLLTFAAINGFRRLSLWALWNGAEINRQDQDGRTMLSASIQNDLTYMKEFALQHGAGATQGIRSFLLSTNMAESMDNYIRYYMESGYLSADDMNAFEIHGRRFEHFLAINGFAESLEYRLHYYLPRKQAENRIFIRDIRGFDVLQAAIQSLNYSTVQTVLKLNSQNINVRIPKRPEYQNIGDKPLETARRLDAPYQLIQLLISYHANDYKY